MQVAARLVSAFTTFKQFDAGRQAQMKEALGRISKAEGLSENVYEIVSKSLKMAAEEEEEAAAANGK